MTKIQFIKGPLHKEMIELEHLTAAIVIPIITETISLAEIEASVVGEQEIDLPAIVYERTMLKSSEGIVYYRMKQK